MTVYLTLLLFSTLSFSKKVWSYEIWVLSWFWIPEPQNFGSSFLMLDYETHLESSPKILLHITFVSSYGWKKITWLSLDYIKKIHQLIRVIGHTRIAWFLCS